MPPSPWPPTTFPNTLPAPVAEKTKEQASHLGGAVFSGAGNIAAATGLMKKEEFPTDLKVSDPPTTHTHTCTHTHTNARHTHEPATRFPAPPASLGHKTPVSHSATMIQLWLYTCILLASVTSTASGHVCMCH